MKSTVKHFIDSNSTTVGRSFDIIVQLLIVVSLISFSIETLPGLSPKTYAVLHSIETATIVLFSFEYGARLWVADSKLKFATSFFGVVDLLAILPSLLWVGIDLRSIRIVRMLRLIRILKLTRYSKTVQRFHRAFRIAKEELTLFGVVTLMLLFLSAVGIYYFEHEAQPEVFASVPHSLWWALATLTTVGYGDAFPVTVGGKIFTSVMLFVGLGVVSVPAGLVASALSKAREIEPEFEEMTKD